MTSQTQTTGAQPSSTSEDRARTGLEGRGGRRRTRPPRRDPAHARYDHGLAEFPAFRFGRRRRTAEDIITFADSIRGPDGQPLERQWTVHPSRFGYGGATTQALLFDLHQVWKEQGFRGTRIYFGTLRSLYQRQHPGAHPGLGDYNRLRRDLSILCGYKFDCESAFWDPATQCYGTMRDWSLFTGWFEAHRKGADALQEELPFGFIEVSDTFAKIANERGFFVTGFDSAFFHGLRPTEQRLALYLSKFFASQEIHRRKVETLCDALPIEGPPRKQRQTLKSAAQGLVDKGFPGLAAFHVRQHPGTGNWIASFKRGDRVEQQRPVAPQSLEGLAPEVRALVDDVVELTKDEGSTRFYVGAIRALGPEAFRYAMADLKSELMSRSGGAAPISNPGSWLTKKLIAMAEERGVAVTRHQAEQLRGDRRTAGPRSRGPGR